MQAIRDRQSYAYDALRVFHYDLNGLLIAETDATTGATLIEYVYADRALVAVYTTRHTGNTLEWFYVNANHLQTPEQLVDQNKQVVWQAEYRAFGVWQLSIEEVTFNLRFPGQYVDEETGLVNNWHRYYDPELGRYITPDPLGLYDGVNTYAYAGLNPINYVDPTGLYFEFNQSGNSLNITLDIVVYGEHATQHAVTNWQNAINREWNGFFYKGCKVNIQAELTMVDADTLIGAYWEKWGAGNYIRAFSNRNLGTDAARSNVINGWRGNWNVSDYHNNHWVAAHEAGHLMGLRDYYDKFSGYPLPGREGTMMGQYNGKVRQDEINQILQNLEINECDCKK